MGRGRGIAKWAPGRIGQPVKRGGKIKDRSANKLLAYQKKILCGKVNWKEGKPTHVEGAQKNQQKKDKGKREMEGHLI